MPLKPYNKPNYNDLPSPFPPACASAWGEDSFGVWFDLRVDDVVQRFRWIPKGQFTMGSPDNEAERSSSIEVLHEVTLTRGYWLADTACTQALWQAVMNANPSSFKDNPLNPVEQVSWLDVQDFLAKLNQAIPNLKAQLPSEAQWEYACRAGTITPFSFGDNITPKQVNYDGNYPYANGAKGLYREKTLPVQGLEANHWGLYQMHGNVREWCFDEFQENLGAEPVVNPVHARFKPEFQPSGVGSNSEIPSGIASSSLENLCIYDSSMLENAQDSNVYRVLRGGSWDSYGRNCRSAHRLRYGAVFRDSYTGFRFCLGL